MQLAGYTRSDFTSDLIAGVITATLLVPQAMAYSQLAGLPPQIGLYASMAPPVLYALVGSSRTMAVGPVAVASLMLAAALTSRWPAGSPEYLAGALVVAGLVGLLLTIMGLARLGVVANFLSHPVLSGFTNAAALVILVSQLPPLLGLSVPRGDVHQVLGGIVAKLEGTHVATAALAAAAVALLVVVSRRGGRGLAAVGVPERRADVLVRVFPLVLVAAATLLIGRMLPDYGITVVGDIPRGLPPLALPPLEPGVWFELSGAALAIALVSFVESLSIARVLAARRRQKVNADRELVGLGVANLGAAFTGASPVCGGFSRSVVNFEAGARTQVASIVTAAMIAFTALFLTPWFYHLPVAVLAAIVVVSVTGLFDLHTLRLCWRYNRADAMALAATFVTVLVEGMEAGIAVGVALSAALFLWRTSRPHAAVVGRVGDTEHFRNVDRHSVTTYPGLLAIRVDESLYYANTQALEELLLNSVADRPDVRHVVLICSAVNFIDTSALETLENLADELRGAGTTLHLAEVKGPVMDGLKRVSLLEKLSPGRVFLSTHEAVATLAEGAGADGLTLFLLIEIRYECVGAQVLRRQVPVH
ncbi:MAG: sulfate permease [Gammaproteobacteria bacterium]|nr:sulfate permease [Gammaproteobacteria bacterium]